MSRKTRKLIWSAPLLAVLAVAGALAIFAAQTPQPALAHDLPGAVENLMVDEADFRTIDLSWEAPSDGGTPTSYRIDRSTDGDVWITKQTGITATMFQDTMLKAGTDYYYRVFAVNSAGTGPVSDEVTGATKDAEAPGIVRGLTARVTGQNSIELEWTAPAKDGGSPITMYQINFASGITVMPGADVSGVTPDATAGFFTTDDATSTTFTHTYTHKGDNPATTGTTEDDFEFALVAGTRYRYQVYAVNATGKSEPGETAASTTLKLEKPGAPTGVTAVQTNTRTFSLYWYAPANTGGAPISNYVVQVAYNGSSNFESPGGDNIGTAITYAASATASPDATYEVPTTLSDTTTAITRVRFRVYAETGPSGDRLRSTSAGESATMSFLDDDARTKNIPSAPTLDATTCCSRDSFKNVELKWTAPPVDSDHVDTTSPCDATDRTGCDDDNAPESLDGYRIDVSDDGISWMALQRRAARGKTEYEYVDTQKKTRHYRIFAWHAQYLGPAAAPEDSEFSADAVTAPGHVSGLTATASGPTQIDLSWTAPTTTGNAPVVEYRIQRVMKGGTPDTNADGWQDWPAAADTAGTAPGSGATAVYVVSKTTSYSHEKLKAGQTWRYRVLAVNEDGDGDKLIAPAASAAVRQATTSQADLPEAPEMLVAEAAKDSNLGGIGDRGVLLLWNAPNPPDGAAIDGYRVQRKKGDGAWETIASDTGNDDTLYHDTSEPEDDELRAYQVAALNGNKVGAYSDMVYYPHALAQHTPGMPQNVSAEVDATTPTTINVTWEAAAPYGSAVTGYMVQSRHMMADGTMSEWMDVDPAHSGMDMMYADTGLMAETKYYYRVLAMNANGNGEYSDGMAAATTGMAALGKPTNVMATVDRTDPAEPDVTVTWTDGENADVHWVFLLDILEFPKNLNERVPGTPSAMTHTFSNVASGTYVVAVQSTLGEDYAYDLARQENGRAMILVIE